jgi:hypothetical protein
MGRGGHIPEEILLHPDNPQLAGYELDSAENGDRHTVIYANLQYSK